MINRNYKGPKLRLDLDSMAEEEYFYTEYDIEGSGHSITIKEEDKERFLDAWAKVWRDRAAKKLKLVPIDEE